VETPCGVLVDYEESAAGRLGDLRQRSGWFGGALERPLGPIKSEGIRFVRRHERKVLLNPC
jgi:hypothetical protein